MSPQKFIDRWKDSGGAELANSQSFLKELCTLLDTPHPEPTKPDESQNTYVFEKAVVFHNGDGTTSDGRVDLFREHCFVLESKQGVERKEAEMAVLAKKTKAKKFRSGTAMRGTAAWDSAMVKAREQARRYAEALPNEWPPFLIVVDVGHCLDLYADFSGTGKNYAHFPDPLTYRIRLDDLRREGVRETLRTIWLDPLSLDPSRKSAKVTREVAARLAKLAKSLEGKHSADLVAQFLMRCLFTMFAEDVEIGGFSKGDFTRFLEARRGKLDTFVPMLSKLWEEMDTGGFSVVLEEQLQQFNGGLFEDQTALPLTEDQLEFLIEAAEAEWSDVEPAIFGTLLERALDPIERHKLGAHYTPRAYVERLVMPTIIEPLREEWETAYATAMQLENEGDRKGAVAEIRNFHQHLCNVRVLDPACGSGNFLYVSLELMKRLEGEVLNTLVSLGGETKATLTIDPHQFLGIEINPRAAAITDLVLWIGYLQWHFRTRGNEPLLEPIIRKFHNIECRDAVLAWDAIEPVVDEEGKPVTRWDGRTTKPHPVTGEKVPDETARVQELRYINPRKADWPNSDYIVGNPPFIGTSRMRDALGVGYSEAVRSAFASLPESCDYVMYWWDSAADLARNLGTQQFGFITTSSLPQTFNRRVVTPHLEADPRLSIAFAIPNHPWVDSADGADVRISMTVGCAGLTEGRLLIVKSESSTDGMAHECEFEEQRGVILADLRIGTDISQVAGLMANEGVSAPGMEPHGKAFIVDRQTAEQLGLGRLPGVEHHIRPYRNGRDISGRARGVFALDLYGLTDSEVRDRFPQVYQWVFDRVKPNRDVNPRESRRKNWWIFGEASPQWRAMSKGIPRFIATVKTSKHRFFVFLEKEILPDSKLIVFGLSDAYMLGVLSGRPHCVWALVTGSRLGVGNDPTYVKSISFEGFPFPTGDELAAESIRKLGEQLDAMPLPEGRKVSERQIIEAVAKVYVAKACERAEAAPWPEEVAA